MVREVTGRAGAHAPVASIVLMEVGEADLTVWPKTVRPTDVVEQPNIAVECLSAQSKANVRISYACTWHNALLDLLRQLICSPITRPYGQAFGGMHASGAINPFHEQATRID